jgi:hypothetical protein
MKRVMRIFFVGAFVFFSTMSMFSTPVNAIEPEQKAPLGTGNVALKLDYITFTDDEWSNVDDDGLYLGVEGYWKVDPNVYVGGEIGEAINVSILGDDISFIPVELNVKYATEIAPNIIADFGAGASFSYAEITDPWSDESEDDWLFGGQVFGDLTYKIKSFSIGVNAKYQMTQDFKDSDVDLSNWRLGLQLGVVF